MPTALVVGGTGPTGPFVVNGLVARGYDVTIMHTGRHESDDNPDTIEHLHTDPFDREASARTIGGRSWDLGVVMYGRLRVLAPLLAERVERLLTIGGVGAVAGWVDPGDLFPTSMTVPAPDDAPLAGADEPIGKVRRIVETENTVFAAKPEAVHLRYPMLYGPRQLLPAEWSFVRRARDRRRPLIVADGGLTLKSTAYVENAAHAVLCVVDRFDEGRGRIFNMTDERTLTLRQTAEVVAHELGHEFEFVNLPAALAVPARPTLMHWSTGHRVVNTAALRHTFGYRDLVPPEEGVRRTARWLLANPPSPAVEKRLQDPFDYPAEDRLIQRWRATIERFEMPTFAAEPGYGGAYYGRRPNPASGTSRVEPLNDS